MGENQTGCSYRWGFTGLSPLLRIICLNYLDSYATVNPSKYADDTDISTIVTRKEVSQALQDDPNKLFDW